MYDYGKLFMNVPLSSLVFIVFTDTGYFLWDRCILSSNKPKHDCSKPFARGDNNNQECIDIIRNNLYVIRLYRYLLDNNKKSLD